MEWHPRRGVTNGSRLRGSAQESRASRLLRDEGQESRRPASRTSPASGSISTVLAGSSRVRWSVSSLACRSYSRPLLAPSRSGLFSHVVCRNDIVASWLPRGAAFSTSAAQSLALHFTNQQGAQQGVGVDERSFGRACLGTLATQPSVEQTALVEQHGILV